MSDNVVDAPKRKRRSRSSPVARPAFVIVQITDEAGEPVEFNKRHLRVVAVERNAEKVMEDMDSGKHPHAFYLRVVVPPGVTRPQQKPQAAAA